MHHSRSNIHFCPFWTSLDRSVHTSSFWPNSDGSSQYLFDSHLEMRVITPLGYEGPQWGSVELICPSVCLSVSLSGRPRRFLAIIRAASNCAQRMRPQAEYVRPSVRPSVQSSVGLLRFLYIFISGVVVQRRDAFIWCTFASRGNVKGLLSFRICKYHFVYFQFVKKFGRRIPTSTF